MSVVSGSTVKTSADVDPAGFEGWKTPVPFLFVGLGLMVGLIAAALLILVCSFKKSPLHTSDEETQMEVIQGAGSEMQEPKMVVIMAGRNTPTYLANPSSFQTQQQQHLLMSTTTTTSHNMAASQLQMQSI